jgi:hypothetical protein
LDKEIEKNSLKKISHKISGNLPDTYAKFKMLPTSKASLAAVALLSKGRFDGGRGCNG